MPGTGTSLRRRGRLPAAAACAIAALLAAACQGGSPAGAGESPKASDQLLIRPANGSSGVNPGSGLTVTAAHGKITSVQVADAGGPTSGTLNAGGTSWHSTWALGVSQHYTVTARAVTSSGQTVTRSSTFTTLTPGRTATTMIFEGSRQTYGVGMPIMLTFSHPVVDKAAVERALQLRTSKPVVGAWSWDGSTSLSFRPRSYWPPDTVVSFTGHLDGVQEAPGVYGAHTLTQSFTIGSSLIVVASTSSHYMRLYRDGQLIDRWPISTGRPGDNTPNGTYLTIDKGNPVDMVGPGYNIEVPWSVRFTWTGDYLHDAYWSVGEQGSVNVSHGCVNMPPADAQAYYNMEVPGDPVTVTGSPRAGAWDNGWTEWFLPWPRYVAGSALHMAVEAGPSGSTFVNPSALPAATATAPLGQPDPNNWAAS
ncbi:MAG TPA: Ig-like domain-containing protein [Streptosporangiaceae bacterium]|nr:Ig-like domain-containing protein [Streptosporangiaceae bacterium]